MTVEQIVLLALFLIVLFLCVGFALIYFIKIWTIKRKVADAIITIEEIDSPDINFLLSKAHNGARYNQEILNLIASWTAESKEMRVNSAMAKLHLQSINNLLLSGKIKEAVQYVKPLDQSMKIMEHKWMELKEDIKKIIAIVEQPISLITELKNAYGNIFNITNKILILNTSTKTLHMEGKQKEIELTFEKFEGSSDLSKYHESMAYALKIKTLLLEYCTQLGEIPVMAYLVEVVYAKEKKTFKKLYEIATKNSVLIRPISPIERFKAINKKMILLNSSFLQKKATRKQVFDKALDEILSLNKLSGLIRSEIECKELYLGHYGSIEEQIRVISKVWRVGKKKGAYKYFSNLIISNYDRLSLELVKGLERHKNMKKNISDILYSKLLRDLNRLIEKSNLMISSLKADIIDAIELEKEREMSIQRMNELSSDLRLFLESHSRIAWSHIRKYLVEESNAIKSSSLAFSKMITRASYDKFDDIRHSLKVLVERFQKLDWELNNLIRNENNIRILYEIANRFRSESISIDANLAKAEHLIAKHDIKGAYELIKKILRRNNSKALKKHPIKFK